VHFFGPIPAAAQADAVLVSIAVTPAGATVTSLTTQQYTATGTYDDLSTADITGTVTWSVTGGPGTASITSAGLLTGLEVGQVTVKAVLGAIEGSTTATIVTASASTSIGGFAWTMTIEGLPHIIASGTASAALTAYSGTAFTAAYSGLVVDLKHVSAIHPYDPLLSGGGCNVTISGEANAVLGLEMHRTDAGDETYLNATADRNDTTLTVLSTADFASSGDAYIGNECFGYTGKTATTFTGCDRGKYAPFDSATDAGNFSLHHRVGLVGPGVNIEPLVTQFPRTQLGRKVEIVLHLNTGGTLETRAVAVAAGRRWAFTIGDYDDTAEGNTVIDLVPLIDSVKEATVFRDQLVGTVREGVRISASHQFNFYDETSFGPNTENANTLTLAAGYYTADEIITEINEWLNDELDAGRLNGNYVWERDLENRARCVWETNTGTATNFTNWKFTLPTSVAQLLGILTHRVASLYYTVESTGSNQVQHEFYGEGPCWRILIPDHSADIYFENEQVGIEVKSGTAINQVGSMPQVFEQWAQSIDSGAAWGIVLIDGRHLAVGKFDSVSDPTELVGLRGQRISGIGEPPSGFVGRQFGDHTEVPIKQILMVCGPFDSVVKKLFYSTGTAGYNHATWDTYAYGVGVGIPDDVLGTNFINSVDGLPQADMPVMVTIDKPGKLLDILKSDLITRRCHLIWKGGGLRFVNWSTPHTSNSVHTLTESNKSEPADFQVSFRTVSRKSSDWAFPTIEVQYARDLRTGVYQRTFTVTDRTALDDLGGGGQGGLGQTLTLPCRNIYGDATTQIEDSLGELISFHSYFSRPIWLVERSIDLSLATAMAAGDVATISDNHVRTPATGLRGISGLSALVVKVEFNPPTPDRKMTASATLALLELDRMTVYAPCARVDDTAANGGYNAATDILTTYDNEHSETGAAVDATHFAVDDVVRIVEIDPTDPAAPTTWIRTVKTVSGNEIGLLTALSSPAWDSAKKYRIISDNYSQATATQKADCYQADDADALIEDVAGPYQFADASLSSTFTASAHTDLPERHATNAYGDGEPYDVGYQRGLVRMTENLTDHKTAPQTLCFDSTERTSAATGSDWDLLRWEPVFLQTFQLQTTINRALYSAPFFKSTDGTSTDLRVSLCSQPPTGTSFLNVTRNGVFFSQTFTTTSTSFAVPAEAALSLRARGGEWGDGLAWLVIEYKAKCVTRGLAEAVVREREFS
jgi:hypothetical protein